MKRDITFFFILVFILTAFTGAGQSYVVEYFEEKYDTLDTYTSICNENAKNAIEPFFLPKSLNLDLTFLFLGQPIQKYILKTTELAYLKEVCNITFIYLQVYGMYIIGTIRFDMKVPGLLNPIGDMHILQETEKRF